MLHQYSEFSGRLASRSVVKMHRIEDIEYFNNGDWVQSCSALVEHYDGRIAIVHHERHPQRSEDSPAAVDRAPAHTEG